MTNLAKRSERQDEILRVLKGSGAISVGDLANTLGASQATLRRDIRYLTEAGLLQRRSGRVELKATGNDELPLLLRSAVNREEKQRIARAALQLIQNGETIMLSGGTTTLELARLLPGQRRLTVITNALPVADLLSDQPGINLIVLGGVVRLGERTMHGHLTESGAQELRADKFFYGIQAVSLQHGLTHNQLQEVTTDRALANSATQLIVLADHSKFGRVAPALVLPLARVHTLITGCDTPADVLEGLMSQGVHVLSV